MKIIFFLLLSQVCFAYQLTQDFRNGFYWANLPVKIVVSESIPSKVDVLKRLSQKAVQEWESKSGFSLWSFVNSGTPNLIRWSDNFAQETKYDAQSVLAVAIRYTDGPYFARTEIIINGNHPINSVEQHLQTTITHELGHTLGLDHSENMNAVMAPTLQYPYYGLHQDDLDGMNEVVTTTQDRERVNYVSPLAYEEKTSSSSPLSCGTVQVSPQGLGQGYFSLALGVLLSVMRRVLNWFKNLR